MTIFFPIVPWLAATFQGTGHLFLGSGALAGIDSQHRVSRPWITGRGRLLDLLDSHGNPCCRHRGIGGGARRQAHPLMGLAERLTIGLFLAWVFVLSVRLLAEDAGTISR